MGGGGHKPGDVVSQAAGVRLVWSPSIFPCFLWVGAGGNGAA
jgi:hypothetical protein